MIVKEKGSERVSKFKKTNFVIGCKIASIGEEGEEQNIIFNLIILQL
jgi:hypothetical protein